MTKIQSCLSDTPSLGWGKDNFGSIYKVAGYEKSHNTEINEIL